MRNWNLVCILVKKINKTYRMLWLIKRKFNEIDNKAFILLYKHLVRAHLEYNNSVWAQYKRCDIEKLEKVQKRATKLLLGLRKMPYPERLKKLGLPTLIYRRSRGDMIETYKLLSGKYDSQVALKLSLYLSDDHHTRGNSRKLLVKDVIMI